MQTLCRPDDKDIARFGLRCRKRGDWDCWIWTGTKHTKYGIGLFWTKQQGSATAIRYLLAIQYGFIDKRIRVRRVCDNPACINPAVILVGWSPETTAGVATTASPWYHGNKATTANLGAQEFGTHEKS